MTEEIIHLLEKASHVISLVGVVVVVGGFLVAAVQYAARFRRLGPVTAFGWHD